MKKIATLLSLFITCAISQSALADTSSNALIKKGEYLAQAGDCTACHTAEGGKSFAGGYVFKMPMGSIVSSNITSSKKYGIGNWTEAEFAKAVRQGVRPDGSQLYPAMPYTSYSTVTDEDMHALYAYFQSVPAVEDTPPDEGKPAAKTRLLFPFNLPGLMRVWNFMFVSDKPFTPSPDLTPEQNRGKYLAEGLGHCSTCHTPRNQLMAEDNSQFLAGASVDGWLAPNITSDNVSGIGGWSNAELVSYLKNGHAEGKGQAGGPMADAVEHSFSHLTDSDLADIAAYLKTVPAKQTAGVTQTSWSASRAEPVNWTTYEPGTGANNAAGYRESSQTDGALLYDSSCAACHGANGQGTDDHTFPSLTNNSAVGSHDPANLVMTIVAGIHRKGADGEVLMPAFGVQQQDIHSWLTPAQIAVVANYVTEEFGHGNAHLTEDEVNKITSGEPDSPFLIRYAKTLAIAGFILAALVVALLLAFWVKKRKTIKV